MKSAKRWACVLAAAVGLFGAGVAVGQDQPAAPTRPARGMPPKATPPPAPAETPDPSAQPGTQPQPSAPAPAPQATPAAPAPMAPAGPATKWKDPPKVGPYVKQVTPRDLTLVVEVRIHTDNHLQQQQYRDPFSGKTVSMPDITPMPFNTMGFVFPMVPHTGSMDLFADDYRGLLRINGQEVTDQHRVLAGYPAGVKLAVWDAGSQDTVTEARQIELHVEAPERLYNTTFDETGAMGVTWPTMAWPAEAASCLQPQLYVEAGVDDHGQVRLYEDKLLKATMKELFDDKGFKDLTRVPPVRVAKMITAKVWESVQVTGEGMVFMRTGELSGMDLQSPETTLETGKGSEQDMAVLLCALMKKAGLPTRTVIGYDVNVKENRFLEKGNKNNRIRTWVEFALYDEMKNTINWVPVDVARMRKGTSRAAPVDRTWRYFGAHDELNNVPVMALQFHPPTDVVSYGAPAFWGWFVTPAPAANAEQALRFMATVTSTRGGDANKDPNAPKDDKKKPLKRGY